MATNPEELPDFGGRKVEPEELDFGGRIVEQASDLSGSAPAQSQSLDFGGNTPSQSAALNMLLETEYAQKIPGGKITEGGGPPLRFLPTTKVGGKQIKTTAVGSLAGLMSIFTKAMSTHQEEGTLAEALAMREIGPIKERHLVTFPAIQSLRKTANRFEREYNQAVRELNPNKVEEAWISAVNSMAIWGAAIPATLVAGPGTGAAVFALSELGRVYDEDRRLGISEDKALAHAITNAGIEFVGERIAMGKWAKMFDTIDDPIKRRIIRWLGTEIATELGQESFQALSDVWFDLREMLSPKEWGELWLLTAMSTAMVGGVIGPISSFASNAKRLHQKRKANKFIDNTLTDVADGLRELEEKKDAGLLSPMDYEQSVDSIRRNVSILKAWVEQNPELSEMFGKEISAKLPLLTDLDSAEGVAIEGELVEQEERAAIQKEIENEAAAYREAGVEGLVASNTKAQLQDIARDWGLPVSGTKTQLAERILTQVNTMMPVEEAPTTEKKPPPATPQETKVKRAKDFADSGNYDVTLPDGTQTQIFRDTEQFGYSVWYEVGTDKNLGSTRKEAIATLERIAEQRAEEDEMTRDLPDTWSMYARVPQPYGAKYNTVEVLKNPTKAELRQFAKETPKALRWGKDTRGNYYFWDAYKAIHLDIEQALQKDDPALGWDAFEWQSFSEDFIGSKPAEVATEAELRGYDFRVQRERQWMTITPKGEGVPSSETLRWQRSKAKQQELTFRITLEAIPSPKTEAGQRISEMPFDLQLAFTREVNETAPIKRIAAELGIDVYVTEQTGGYHGMVAPNNVVQVRSAEDATKLARALALTRTQESVPWFHVSQQEPPTGDLAVYIEFDEDLTLDQRVQLSSLLSRVGKDISFTELGENRFAIINFSNIENFEDKVHDAIAQVEGMGRTNDFDLIPFNPDESFYEEYDWSKSGTEEEIVRLAGFTPTEAANLRRWRQATQSVADNFLDQEKQKLTRQDFKPGERLDRPVVEPDGTITLHHWSTNDNISEIDPVFEGSGIRAAERVRAQAFPEFYVSRSNYGINVGLPGGYVKEFSLGRYHYTAKINADDLYDAHGDPNNLKRVAEREIGPDANDMAFHNAYERAIRDAGFKGFWVNNGGKKGITAAVFEPLQASRVQEWRNEFIPSTDTSVFRDPETGRWVNLDNVLSSLWARQEREQGPGGSFESVPLNNEAREVINSALQNVPKAIAGMVSSFGFLENHQDPNVDGNFNQGDKSIDIKKKSLLNRRGMKILFHEMGHAISMWYSGHNHIGGIVSKSPLYHFNPLNHDEANVFSMGEVIDETGQAWDRGWELIEEVKGRTSAEIDASERGVGTLLVEARRLGYSDKDIAYIQTAVWMNYPLDSLGNIVNHYQMAGALGTGTLEQMDLFLRQVVGFSRQTIQEEVFAQHHSMYHVAPALMKQTLPKAYEVINEIYTLVAETNTLGAANAAVFRALRTPRPASSSESVLARDFVSKSNAGNSAEWRSQRQPPSTGVQRVAARRGWNRSGNTTRRDKVWAKLVNWFGWMTPTSQFVYRPGLKAFWDGYSDHLDEQLAYDERRSLAQGEVWRGGALAKKVVKVFDGLPESMLSGAYEYFTTPNVSAKQVINKPPEWTDKQFYQWTRRVERVKRILESVGQQLVDIGLLSQEVFEQHKGSYLPRMYLQYVLGDEGIHMLANHGRLDLNYLKRRKDVPKHIRELFLGEIKDPGFLLSMAVGRGMRDIAIHKFLDDVSTNQNWVAPATLISIPVGEQYDHDDPNGNYAKGDEIYVDVTPQWAKHEGERILSMIDKYHPATRKAARAVANRLIAGADRHLENANIQFDTKTYELLPDSAKYGHLRGAWVRKEIAWDVKGAFSVAADMDYMGWYLNHSKKLMGYWKVNKIALNPPTIARNIMSNMVLLNLSGMPLFRPTKHNVGWMMFHDAIKEINSNGKYYREFVKRGGKSSTFSSAELSHIQGEFKRYYQGSGRNVMYAMAKAVDAIYETAGDVYQFTEMVGKIAKMKYEVEVNNLSMGEAMHEANKWLFDYSFVPKAIEFVRSEMVFGVPFITFYYKVIARIAETAVKHPTRFLPYVALSYGMQPLIAAMMPDIDDDDIERAKTELPYFIRERLGMIPLPFRDANGNLQFLDMSYIFPWTMPLDTLRAAGTLNADKLASTLGLAGSPLMSSAVGLISNKHPFYRTDIWKEKFMADAGFKSYDKSEQITSRLNYLWNVWTPGLLGTTSANPIVKTAEAISPKRSAYLRTPPTVGQAGLRFIGINVYPTNKQALINNARIMQTRINSFKAMVRSEAARDLDSTKETFDKYLPRVLEFEQELADYMRNMGISEEELRE